MAGNIVSIIKLQVSINYMMPANKVDMIDIFNGKNPALDMENNLTAETAFNGLIKHAVAKQGTIK